MTQITHTIKHPELAETECTINYRPLQCAYEIRLWDAGISQYADGMFMYKYFQDAVLIADYLLEQWNSGE